MNNSEPFKKILLFDDHIKKCCNFAAATFLNDY